MLRVSIIDHLSEFVIYVSSLLGMVQYISFYFINPCTSTVPQKILTGAMVLVEEKSCDLNSICFDRWGDGGLRRALKIRITLT